MLKKTLSSLMLITLLAAVVRFWQLNTLPAQLNRDEAAIGLNARLLAETGKDEWGRSWPLALESFGDYKLPGYVWLTVLSGISFGWHDWAVRLPSALAGTVLPLLLAIWLKKLGKTDQQALWVAVLAAVLPVSWFYSRMAFEANVALALLIVWLILVTQKQHTQNQVWLDVALVIIAIVLVLTYNTPLLLLPFMLLYLPFYWGLRNWKSWSGVWIVLWGVALGGFYLLSQLFGQKSGITLFTDPSIWTFFVEGRTERTGIVGLIQSSWYGYLLSEIASRFFASWSPLFLVSKGGTHPWHTLPGAGHLFWTHYVLSLLGFCIAGLWQFAIQFKLPRLTNLLAAPNTWLVFLTMIALAPAVITTDAPHATRSLLFLVLLVVWASEGLELLRSHFKKSKYATTLLAIVCLVLLAETLQYANRYFTLYPQQQTVFQPGLSATIAKLNSEHPTVPIAVVGDGYSYAIWSWYLQLAPDRFFETVIKQLPDRIGFRYGQQVDRYHFIMNAADRSETEPILVEWRENRWQIRTF